MAQARAYVDEAVNALETPALVVQFPQAILWQAADVYRAIGDEMRSQTCLEKATALFFERLNRLPDAESRQAFSSFLWHREIIAAVQNAGGSDSFLQIASG